MPEAPPLRLTLGVVPQIEEAVAAVARLDGRISASPVAKAWRLRAAWSGYARGLRLQGVEIDEIDVFSWSCAIPLPDRPRRPSHLDEFEGFAPWWGRFDRAGVGQWRDNLPFTPTIARDLPLLLKALDITRQHALRDGSAAPWLALPAALQGLGLTDTPLPCLVGGAKAFRFRAALPEETLRATLRALSGAARDGLALLDGLEADHRRAARAILAERRPGSLQPLAALSLVHPLLSPTTVAERLGLTLSGAGKLLERAAGLDLLHEISGRATWKAYCTPHLAVAFGLRAAPRGRPAHEAPLPALDGDLAAILAAFDREMEAFDAGPH